MSQPASLKPSLFVKLIECLLVGFAAWNIYHSLIMLLVSFKFKGTQVPFIMGLFGIALFFIAVLFALCYPFIWHLKEKNGMIKNGFRHTLFQTVIRYWLALMISTYAFAKILGTQFSADLVSDNSLAKDLSGFDLTWFYFSYSYAFSFTIACIQLAGAIFLLFRRTVFAGVLILLPVMLNIVLINIFYTLTNEAELNAVFYVLALLYLLSNYWAIIKDGFSSAAKSISTFATGNLVKYVFRTGVIAFSFFYIYYLSTAKEPGSLSGKWKVVTLIKGSDTVQSNAWLNDSTAWKYIYIQKMGKVIMNPNPYLVDIRRAQKGQFEYDPSSFSLHIILGKDIKTGELYEFRVSKAGNDHMEWAGTHNGKNVRLSLSRENQ